jgi:hypothetical protein
VLSFFSSRWRGRVPAARLLWRDMLAIGTVVNLLASFAALMLAAQGAPTELAVLMHFSPLPYNLFLMLSLHRAPQRAAWQLGLGLAWLAVVTVV